jgi:hypothetical protein
VLFERQALCGLKLFVVKKQRGDFKYVFAPKTAISQKVVMDDVD